RRCRQLDVEQLAPQVMRALGACTGTGGLSGERCGFRWSLERGRATLGHDLPARRLFAFLILTSAWAPRLAGAEPDGGVGQLTVSADAGILPTPAWAGLSRPELLSDPPRPPSGTRIRGTVQVLCNVRESGTLDHCVVPVTGTTPPDPAVQRMV